jgi:LmbE family N-acetylglucosaminyl deacetylase
MTEPEQRPGAGTVVLAVGAHPDDLEELCGGTLAALALAGATVHMATTTAGESGSYELPAEEIRTIRLGEAASAAAVAGAMYHHLGMRDQGVDVTIDERRRLSDLIRRLGVNLLITHPPVDYHVDHRRTSELVTDARMAAPVPNFGDEPPLRFTPDLVYMDATMGAPFEPHVWIDVTATRDVRRRMLAEHVSQVELMQAMYGQDIAEISESLSRLRGQQRGCDYAEAFCGCRTWPAPDGGIRRLVRILDR